MILVLLAELASLGPAQSFRIVKSTFDDPLRTTNVYARTAIASQDGGAYAAAYIDGLQLTKFDSSGQPVWTRRLALDGWGYDWVESMPPLSDPEFKVVEGATGVFVTGSVRRLSFGGGQAFVAKYDFSGVLQFLRFVGTHSSQITGLILDGADTAYLSYLAPTPTTGFKSYLTKLDRTGLAGWETPVGDGTRSIRFDSSGNILVAGHIGADDVAQGFVQKVAPSGLVQWTYQFTPDGSPYEATDCRPSPDGTLVAAFQPWNQPTSTNEGTVIQKLTPDGKVVWSKGWADISYSHLAVDASGNVYASSSHAAAATVKLNSAGTVLWTKPTLAWVRDSAFDASGNLALLGTVPGANATAIKLDPAGNTLWTLDIPWMNAYAKFSRGDLMIETQDADLNGNQVKSAVIVRRYNLAKTLLWTSASTSNNHSPAPEMLGAVSNTGNTFYWDRSGVFNSISSAGQLAFRVADNISQQPDRQRPMRIVPTSDGGMLSDLGYPNVTLSRGIQRRNAAGAVVWQDLVTSGIGALNGDSSGNAYVLYQEEDPKNLRLHLKKVGPSGSVLWDSSIPATPNPSTQSQGQPGPLRSLAVPADDAQFLSIKAPTWLPLNGTWIVTGFLKNTGTSTWTQAGGYQLQRDPAYSLGGWGLNDAEVPPGATVQFSFRSVAALAPGTYSLQYRMSHNGIPFGQASPLTMFSVGERFDYSVFAHPRIAFDASGNEVVLASGYTYTDRNGHIAVYPPELFKFSPSGALLWRAALPNYDLGFTDTSDIDIDSAGNIFLMTDRYTGGTTRGWLTKYLPNGTRQFDIELVSGDNSPTFSTVEYGGLLYAVGNTRVNGVVKMSIFCVDGQTGVVQWLSTPNPGLTSGAKDVFVDKASQELRVAGWRYAPATGHDYVLLGLNLQGGVDRLSTYDSGYMVRDLYDGAGIDAQNNVYIFGRAVGPSGTYDWNVVKFSLPPADWASTDIPSIPNKMATGGTYSGTVNVTNTGLNTWTAATGYKLDCVQGSTWSLASVPLAAGDSIAPGQTKVFSFTVTAPSTPGAYPLTFKMEHSGVQFDNASSSLGIQAMTQTNFAQFVGQTVPTAMVAGQSYAVSVQYKNTGSNTWTPGNGYKLQSVNPLNNTRWGVNRLSLVTSSVPPGSTGTFSGTVIAPMASGTYNFQWQPIQDTTGLAFGSPSTNVAVTVTNAGDAARYLSKTGPLTVNAGTDFYVQNTMLNVGSNAWSTAAGYSLRAIFNNWGAMNIFLPGSVPSVAPGAQVTFTKLLTAPLVPGTYPMQWQMLHGSTLFGDKTPYLNISVVQGPYNAKFNSQSVLSTSVAAGTTFGCTFSMQNLGTTTWDSTVKLSSIGSSPFGVPSIPVTGTVVQNANSSFSATFTAPATPGTYTFQFRMQSPSGTYFGQPSTPVTIVVTPADAAQFISKTGPVTVNAGSDFYVQNTFKNTGTSTWSSASGFNLRSINPLDNLTWGRNRIYLPGTDSVAPGGSVTLTGLCTAPSQPGTYTMQWQMNHGSTLFGEKTPALTINVVQSADNAVFLTQTVVPVSVAHGSTFTVNIAMQNVGTAAWGAGYSLVPIGSSAWGLSPLPSGAVPPGGQQTFTANCTAPATPGTYTFQMRMDHSGTKFGQATKLVTVTVT